MSINQKRIDISKIQQQIISQILKEKLSNNEITTDSEYKIEDKKLRDIIKSGRLTTEMIKLEKRIDAATVKEIAEKIDIDIKTCFKIIDELGKNVIRHRKINQAIINNMKTQLAKSNDILLTLEESRRSISKSDIFIEAFRSTENFEENIAYFKDRNDKQLTSSHIVAFDKFNENIHPPHITKNNLLTGSNGVSFARAKITMQLGQDLRIDENNHPIKNILDNSIHTYWKETIKTDSPMRVSLNDDYFNIEYGAVCEIEIKLETASNVNEISLNPYGAFPFELVSIRYFETDDEEENIKTILSPNNANKSLCSKIIDKPITVRFSDTLCKKIRILINQIHYTHNSYFFNSSYEQKAKLLSKSEMNKYIADKTDVFKAVYEKRKIMDEAWAIMNALIKDKEEITAQMFTQKSNKQVPVNKYSYSYGFNSIDISFSDYQQIGVYVSKPISASNTIKSLTLESSEVHDVINGRILSDIEFYISTSEKGENSKWIPIAPINVDEVKSELLQFNMSTNSAKPRLLVKDISTIQVLANGSPLVPVFDYSIESIGDNEFLITLENGIKPNAIYTASYEVHKDAKLIELVENDSVPQKTSERLKSNGQTILRLNNSPYNIGYETRVEVHLPNGTVLKESKNEIKCMTNIKNPEQSYMEFTNESLEYYINRNSVYFNQKIERNSIVQVEYYYFTSNIRIKAIMRKNTHKQPWAVPVLNGYKVNFETL